MLFPARRPFFLITLCLFTARTACSDEEKPLVVLERPVVFLEGRAERDDTREENAGSRVERGERFFQERLRGDVRGYVYDERFLDFRVGGGLALSQSRVTGPGGRFTRPRDVEYRTRLDLLPRHAVSSTFESERLQTVVWNPFSGRSRMALSRKEGGLSLSRGPAPMGLRYRDARLSSDGFGDPFEQRTRSVDWSGRAGLGAGAAVSAHAQALRFSDSLGPGHEEYASDALLEGNPGGARRWRLSSRYFRRDGALSVWETENAAEGRVGDGPLSADLRLSGGERETDGQEVRDRRASLGVEHRLFESLTSGVRLEAARLKREGEREIVRSLTWREDYVKRLWGPLRLTLQGQWDRRENRRRFEGFWTAVLDEPHALTDGAAVFLGGTRADRDSVTITRADKTRRYEEGIDYTLVSHDDLVEVRRVPTGRIVNGENVLASYRHALSGSRRIRETGQTVRAALLLGGRGNLYAARTRRGQRATGTAGGDVPADIEAFDETVAGAELRWRWISAARSRRERRSRTAPLTGVSSSLKAGGSLWGSRLAVGRNHERTLFTRTGVLNWSREDAVEWSAARPGGLDVKAEARRGKTSTAGSASRHKTLYGRLGWTFRALEMEISDRWSRRRVAGASSQENFLQVRALRRF